MNKRYSKYVRCMYIYIEREREREIALKESVKITILSSFIHPFLSDLLSHMEYKRGHFERMRWTLFSMQLQWMETGAFKLLKGCRSTVNYHKAWVLNCIFHEGSNNDGFINESFLFIWPFTVNQLIHITKLQDLFTNETDLILESVIRLQQLTVISVNNNLNRCLLLKQIYDMTWEDSNNSTSHMGHFYSVLCLF